MAWQHLAPRADAGLGAIQIEVRHGFKTPAYWYSVANIPLNSTGWRGHGPSARIYSDARLLCGS